MQVSRELEPRIGSAPKLIHRRPVLPFVAFYAEHKQAVMPLAQTFNHYFRRSRVIMRLDVIHYSAVPVDYIILHTVVTALTQARRTRLFTLINIVIEFEHDTPLRPVMCVVKIVLHASCKRQTAQQ